VPLELLMIKYDKPDSIPKPKNDLISNFQIVIVHLGRFGGRFAL
jgi:hypothetical protein